MSSLIRRYGSLFPSKPPSLKPSASSATRPLEEALALRLRSLLPIPGNSPGVPLPWLHRAVRILALTLAATAALVSDRSLPGGVDSDALTAHLDAGVPFLDACNAASAEIARLVHRLLPLRVALRLLHPDDDDGDENALRQARRAIAEWQSTPSREIGWSGGELIRRMAPDEPPRGSASAVRRATYAAESVSRLVMAAVLAMIGGGEGKALLSKIRVSGEWPWAEAFNEVAAAVSGRLRAALPGELVAVEAAVRRLAGVIDEETEGLGTAVEAVEIATEELTVGLDGLTDGVNGAFHAAMGTRNAALNSLRRGRRGCT
ncbi:hypothetical protein OPV22_002733 [Ensete ventricosum]|uniref:Uncharacterized protein n=1 Tax=Ensete ventricosum TaxID=4639 RepID=A0AAV8RYT4_ENSVE|nr:hypothetical protein OPV22_002733 [Ensete ventricosum]RWW88064.1 hypothetical protein BHE74_00003076 [Ensete ventricosum]RZS15261.1 hypothetical protein BHM03_00047076 [Ensete ventricosum]